MSIALKPHCDSDMYFDSGEDSSHFRNAVTDCKARPPS